MGVKAVIDATRANQIAIENIGYSTMLNEAAVEEKIRTAIINRMLSVTGAGVLTSEAKKVLREAGYDFEVWNDDYEHFYTIRWSNK